MCNQQRNGGSKGQVQSGVQQAVDRIENARGGGRSTSGLGLVDCCWLGESELWVWARENGRGPK
jgi:hypothetical protein